MERFALAGYVVDELIGFGGTGEVWRAREDATGETVALKRLRTRSTAVTERLRREAGLLQAAAGPHVVPVRRMLVDETEAVMVMDYAAGGSLATVLAARGRLPATEVVTIVGPIASALSAAHDRELFHGDLTPTNVLFTAEGRPLLADFGVAHALGATEPGPAPAAADDVFALGVLAFTALAGHTPWGEGTAAEIADRIATGHRPPLLEVAPQTPAAMAEAVEWMLRPDPDDRPDARTAGHAILRSGPAAPVGLVDVAAPDLTPTPIVATAPPDPVVASPVRRTRDAADPGDADPGDDAESWMRWRGRIVVAGVAGAAVVAAIAVGVSLARPGSSAPRTVSGLPPTTPRATPTGTTPPVTPMPRWTSVVSHLDDLRAEAFDRADPAPLASVYVPGTSAYLTDLATVRSLASRGLHADGFAAAVVRVRPEVVTPTTARLRVVDRLSGYRLVGDTGEVAGAGDARPPTAFTIDLKNIGGTWRVAGIKRY